MQIGPYLVHRELGRGGMGVVYGGRSPDGRDVAIKVLVRPAPESLERFERERRLLGSFTARDGIVPLVDAGTCPLGPYLVMPYVGGGTLRERLARGPLGIEETVALACALAEAVGHAHERGMVHRDLKPENVLFTGDGTPLVADLGLAKHFDRSAPGLSQSTSLSAHDGFRGTAGYAAPEQLASARTAGPPADVFALGAIVYECLAGHPAFAGDSVVELMARVAGARFEPLRAVRPDAPAWLAAVVERSLAKDAAGRPADALALLAALRARGARSSPRRGLAVGAASALSLAALALAASRLSRSPAPGASGSRSRSDPALERRAAARALVSSAEGKCRARDFAGALADLDRALEADPGAAPAWIGRGDALEGRHDWDGAVAAYTRAIALDPRDARAWCGRASAHSGKGEPEVAIPDFTRAVELDPKLAKAWCGRGTARGRLGDSAGEEEDYTRAIEADPRDALPRCNRGTTRAERGDWDGALADFAAAIAVDPDDAAAWCGRGIARDKKKDPDGAIADLSRAIELAPTQVLGWTNRGSARAHKGDWEGAIADFTRAIELEPENADAWFNRGLTRDRKGDVEGALADLGRARKLGLAPRQAEAVVKLIAELERRRPAR